MAYTRAVLVALLALLACCWAAGAASAATAIGISVTGDGDQVQFLTKLDAPVGYAARVLSQPYRVVIDVPDLVFDLPPGEGRKAQGLVKSVRYGVIEKGKSRIVIDTTGPVLIAGSRLLPAAGKSGPQISLKLISISEEVFKAALAQDVAPAAAPPKKPVDVADEQGAGDVVGSISPAPPVPKIAPVVAPAKPVAVQAAALLPVKPLERPRPVPVIVIDPGHGGADPGALSPGNTLEKDITLATALRLRDEIMSKGGVVVKMTRDSDVFVSLEDRVDFARRANADLFVAIHADTVHGPTVSGTTIYTLSDQGSDEEAEALAETENHSDQIAGISLSSQKNEIASVLVSLAQRDSRNRAGHFARQTLDGLKGITRMTGKPIRSAGFTVLKAPDIPSVLIELGYLSNAADEERMKSEVWQKMIATSLAASVRQFLAPPEVATR
jgi:N-acetylmuramoyl-L-alanine amidase